MIACSINSKPSRNGSTLSMTVPVLAGTPLQRECAHVLNPKMPPKTRYAEEPEDGDRREIAQHVLAPNAGRQTARQPRRKPEQDPSDAQLRLLVAVDRRDRHVLDPQVHDIELDQHVVLEEEPARDRV